METENTWTYHCNGNFKLRINLWLMNDNFYFIQRLWGMNPSLYVFSGSETFWGENTVIPSDNWCHGEFLPCCKTGREYIFTHRCILTDILWFSEFYHKDVCTCFMEYRHWLSFISYLFWSSVVVLSCTCRTHSLSFHMNIC